MNKFHQSVHMFLVALYTICIRRQVCEPAFVDHVNELPLMHGPLLMQTNIMAAIPDDGGDEVNVCMPRAVRSTPSHFLVNLQKIFVLNVLTCALAGTKLSKEHNSIYRIAQFDMTYFGVVFCALQDDLGVDCVGRLAFFRCA